MNANFQAGYRAIRKAIEILKGWEYLVIRNGKSGGVFDMVGVRKADCIGVQIKSVPFGKVPDFKQLRTDLEAIPAPVNFRKELWIWERRVGFHFVSI